MPGADCAPKRSLFQKLNLKHQNTIMVTKEELQERAQLVRVHEANCQIEHPTPEELNFRMAIMKALATNYNLRELRTVTITGSAPVANRNSMSTSGKK
jgi:hypothetical protein